MGVLIVVLGQKYSGISVYIQFTSRYRVDMEVNSFTASNIL